MASKGKKKRTLYDLSKEPLQSEDLESFVKELRSESDRACALVGAAAIDHQLMGLLKEHMRPLSETEIDEIFFGNNAVLASFSAKTEIAYLFKVINEKEKRSIDKIRRIRNAFAHSSRMLTFQNELVAQEVVNVYSVVGLTKDRHSVKARFTTAVLAILVNLTSKTQKKIKSNNEPKTLGNIASDLKLGDD
jgi:hypothetical protein